MRYKVSRASKDLKGEVVLTASKSIANRLLMIQALCQDSFEIQNLAKAKDTQTLKQILANTSDKIWDVGPAGTTMRFLCAYAASQPEIEIKLKGTDRMHERPIGVLVDALKDLGAEIQYLGKEGYPPLKIKGKELLGGKVLVDGRVSSQYISALILIAPCLQNGIEIQFKGEVASRPYIEMTLKTVQDYGIFYSWIGDTITVKPGKYIAKDSFVEGDWSSASYWYQTAALCENVDFKIIGLSENSLQSDSACVDIFKSFGIDSKFDDKGVLLSKTLKTENSFNYDFTECPDIAQTVCSVMVAQNVSGKLTGLESLRIKETDRIAALNNELTKLGGKLEVEGDDIKVLKGEHLQEAVIETYEDHRMAMAFAPNAIKKNLIIEDPEVVVKSYPDYWYDLEKNGFKIEEL